VFLPSNALWRTIVKSVFSFPRQLTAWHCPHLLLLLTAGRPAVDRYLQAAEPTAANPPQRRAAAE